MSMTAFSLSRLFNRNPPLQTALHGLLAQMGPDACICDPNRNLLAGASSAAERAEYPIYRSGELIGWVSDGAYASHISTLVEWIVRHEEEKKMLGAELIERYRELNLLYHLSENLAATPQPESIIGAALDEALRLNKAKAGLILTVAEEAAALKMTAARGFAYTAIHSGPLIEQVCQSGKADIANDTAGEAYFVEEMGQILSLACAPMKTSQGIRGLIVLVRDQGGIFTADSIKLLNSIAMQIAPLLEVVRLYQVAIQNERIERELLMARQVQESLLPTRVPQLPGWDFARLWCPAREVSGDFYDMIDEGTDRLGLVIADVTDKGMPASLFMAFARTALRASVGRNNTPAEAVAEANRLICQDSFESLYASLFYARLSIASGLCTYVNAGHNPSLLYRAQQDDIVPLTRTGLTVGVDSEAVYEERTVELQPGDFILFYTDGITEAINPAQEEFGMERLRQTLYELKSCPVDEMVSALENALNEYADPAQAFDDVTMMVVRRL
jgi:sigma-B regulation protein RsbU (phosphoserine phosphatase)